MSPFTTDRTAKPLAGPHQTANSALASTALALAAIVLWGVLAALGLALSHVPPFLLTGIALMVGSLVCLPLLWRGGRFDWVALKLPGFTLALGVYGLFGFHFLLFVALRFAPPVEANLVNYLWPLLMVLLAPVLLVGVRLTATHLLAAGMGFVGAAFAILGGRSGDIDAQAAYSAAQWLGFACAAGSAFIWASYSLLTRRVAAFPTAAIGAFAFVSGALALVCHVLLEPATQLSARDWGLLVLTGLGPLGAAFFLWDAALKRGDPQRIGLLSFITPLLSTCVVLAVRGQTPSWHVLAAAALIAGAAVLGRRV